MPPAHNNSQTHCQFGPIPCVVGYNTALSPNDPEVWTHLDQAIANPHDCVPYGDDPYPSLDEVSLSLLLLLVMVLIVFRSIVLFSRFAIGRQIMEKLRLIFVSMT